MLASMRLRTGTSGFAYAEWKGSFYPEKLPAASMLAYYAEHFDSVEINNTFYRMPSADMLRQWAAQVPAGFSFVLKASQRITHQKRLRRWARSGHFSRTAEALGHRLGPILVQLPPNMKKDAERLDAFLSLVPETQRVAVEFRHPSWLDDQTYEVLRRNHAALCCAHGEREETAPVLATTTWGYARLRNVEYSEAELRSGWSGWGSRGRFRVFKHEEAGTGPRLAARFREIFR
jgi:uncharacterized protein YecE (DUF72 family)